MLWVVLDIAIGLLGLVILGLGVLNLYRHGKRLARRVGEVSEQMSELAAGLSVTPPPRRPEG